MEQERDYQTVYFKDLIFAVLYRWKTIIPIMIIGALLLGGFQLIQNRKSAVEQTSSQSGEDMSQREQIRQAISDTDQRIDTQRTYLADSPLMRIDPNQVYQGALVLYIHTDYKIQPGATYQDPDSMPAILAAYQRILSDGDIMRNIAEMTEMPSQYLHELFTCTATTSQPGILNITISASEEETAQQLVTLMTQTMKNATGQIAQQTADHTLIIQSYAPVMRSDTAIADMQKNAIQRLSSLQDQKTEWQKLQTTMTVSGDEANPVLLAVLGALLGALIAAAIVCISHMSSGKVYSERMLKNHTNIKVLGCAPSQEKRSKAGRWLRKLEGRVLNDNSLDVIAANIRNQNTSGTGVLIIGSAPETDRISLREALTAAQVNFTDCGDLLTEPKAFDALSNCSAVVLLEKCNHSTYNNIERVMNHIADQNKPLLGCVLLDG